MLKSCFSFLFIQNLGAECFQTRECLSKDTPQSRFMEKIPFSPRKDLAK